MVRMLGFRKRVPAGDLNPLDMAWSMIEGGTPDEPVSIRRNHALPQLAEPETHGTMLVIDARFDGDGPSEAEFARLNRLEDLLISSLGGDGLAVAAAVVTTPRERRLVFYTGDARAASPRIEAAEAQVGGPELRGGAVSDPDWSKYKAFMQMR